MPYFNRRVSDTGRKHIADNVATIQLNPKDDNARMKSKPLSSLCPCDGTCPKCKGEKDTKGNTHIQPKLKVSNPDDPLEREADKIAEQVVAINRNYGNETMRYNNTERSIINRKCSDCEDKNEKDDDHKPSQINRKCTSNFKENLKVSEETESEINNELVSDRGELLDPITKEFMDSRFNYDFSHVRIHKDVKSAEAVNALAYTIGNDIVFGGGQYNPHNFEGRRLIAHELTHVIQTDLNHNNEMRNRSRINYQIMNPQRELNSCHDSHILFRQPVRTKPVVKLDAQATSIIEFAKNPENGSEEERAIETIRLIINTYYADKAANMPEIIFEEGIQGLQAEVPLKIPGKDFKGKILVGSEFLRAITEDFLGHRVLTVGHELQHIDQYKKGMIGAPLKHEREFLAFYWEAKAPIVPGTGRISPATRRKMIDESLQHFYCLDEVKRQKYNEHRTELRKLREEFNARAIRLHHPDVPEPTGCNDSRETEGPSKSSLFISPEAGYAEFLGGGKGAYGGLGFDLAVPLNRLHTSQLLLGAHFRGIGDENKVAFLYGLRAGYQHLTSSTQGGHKIGIFGEAGGTSFVDLKAGLTSSTIPRGITPYGELGLSLGYKRELGSKLTSINFEAAFGSTLDLDNPEKLKWYRLGISASFNFFGL